MLMNVTFWLRAFLCLEISIVFAQRTEGGATHLLKEVTVSSRLDNFATGTKIIEIDSLLILQHGNNSLADLLSAQSQVFVKSYGIAGLSTPSIRGTNSSQTAILWNGFNLSSPMNGGSDLALIPTNFVNNIKLQFGGAGALWGSGAVGGAIHLNNTPQFDKGFWIQTSSSVGSFADRQFNADVGLSKKRAVSITKLFFHEAQNDFPFINSSKKGKPVEYLQNAALSQKGFLQEVYFQLGNYQKLNIRLWLQKNDRNIPASMSASTSKAMQIDEVLRGTAEWQHNQGKFSCFVRSAYFEELLKFDDPQISLVSQSKTKAVINEAEVKMQLTPHMFFNLGVNNTYNQAVTKNYHYNPTQNRTAFFSSWSIKNRTSRFKTVVSVRKEFVSNNESPFTASVGIEAALYKSIKLRGSASKNYRLPTFNDLYWTQGGNPNLKAENGYNQEIGINYVYCKNKLGLEASLTYFQSNINNWIMWTPDNKGIWSPENLLRVWSRGVETDYKIYGQVKNIKIDFVAHYQFIRTTNIATDTKEKSIIGKQLMYTPLHKTNTNLGLEYRRVRISGSYNHVGERYTSSDNSSSLWPYYFVNLEISKSITLACYTLKMYLQANNITNQNYQIIQNYPIAGRSIQIGLIINFNKPNKK